MLSAKQAEEAEVLIPGAAEGEILLLDPPLSFWGGIDAVSSAVTDPRHPRCGERIAGTIVAMERAVGSSSGSSILLELLRVGAAPAGLILCERDAILTLGVIVGREMGYASIPIYLLPMERIRALHGRVRMEDGKVAA